MGFRDLEDFNKSLLAKQIWRHVQNPTSLVGQILKSKYFPSTNILATKVKHNHSLIWWSLCSSAGLIKEEGLLWRIGNSQIVSIWGDRWLLVPITFHVQSSHQEAKVKDLTGNKIGSWKIRHYPPNFHKWRSWNYMQHPIEYIQGNRQTHLVAN